MSKTEYNVNGQKLTTDSKIEFSPNPKRPNSNAHGRYEKYQSAKTFGQYLKLNEGKYQLADARHDLSKGFLKIQ